MEEIDLKDLWFFFKKKIGLIFIITAIVGIIGCFSMFFKKPMYKSYTTVLLGSSDSIDVSFNKNLINTYAEIAKSAKVLNQVIEQLDLDLSYGSLSSHVSVSASTDTEIITIVAVDSNSELAMSIANATAEVFSKEVVSLYNVGNISILDAASKSNIPYNINIKKQIIIYIFIGLVLSFAIIFTLFYLDRTVKSVEQLEQKIKIPILGSVQDMSTKKGEKKNAK